MQAAAAKNAFVLMSRQKYHSAIMFFLLSGRLSDAVSICIKNLHDYQLGLLLAYITEMKKSGPVYKRILEGHVLPAAGMWHDRCAISPLTHFSSLFLPSSLALISYPLLFPSSLTLLFPLTLFSPTISALLPSSL